MKEADLAALYKFIPRPEEPTKPLWWRGTDVYWELPFFAEMGACVEDVGDSDDAACVREQLWALREQDDEIQVLQDEN